MGLMVTINLTAEIAALPRHSRARRVLERIARDDMTKRLQRERVKRDMDDMFRSAGISWASLFGAGTAQ